MNQFVYFFFLISQMLNCCELTDQTFFNSTASVLTIDENIFTVVTRATLKENTALLSSVFSVMNESSVRPHDLSTVNIISLTSRCSQFNAIYLSFTELLLLLSNVSSVSSI